MRWPTNVVMLDLLVAAVEGQFNGGDHAIASRADLWPSPDVLSSQECAVMVAVCARMHRRTPNAARRAELEQRAQAYWEARLTTPDHAEHLNLEDDADRIFPLSDSLLAGPDERRCRVCGCTDDRACEGGCYWVADDICSACAVAALERALAPEPTNGRRWEDHVPAGGGAVRVVRGFVPCVVADPAPEGGTKP